MIGTNATVSTQRRTESPTGKESWDSSNILTDQAVYLEQLTPDMAVSLSGQFTYDMYRIFFDLAVDLEEGDRVIDADGKKYTVKGVQKFTNCELPDHTEAILMLKSTNES